MYLVKAYIEPKQSNARFKPVVMKGVFIPKKGSNTTELQKIKKQCRDFLLTHLKADHPQMDFKFKSIVVTWYEEKFTVVEDNE